MTLPGPRPPLAPLAGMTIMLASGGFLIVALMALAVAAEASPLQLLGQWFTPRIAAVVWSATSQALLSTFVSLAVAVPVSIVLARHYQAPGMASLRLFIALAMVIPTTVAASGILVVWGRGGIVNDGIALINAVLPAPLGLANLPPIYGLGGVVLAHVFFNAPLMVRVFLPQLMSVTDNHWRTARMLGLGGFAQTRFIEWPAIAPLVIPMLVLVFLFCFSSFALVLMLGGGPRVTTLEVEIYAAIRIEYDFAKAIVLTWLQISVAAGVLFIALPFGSRRIPDFRLIAQMKSGGGYNYITPPPSVYSRGLVAITLATLIVLLVLPVAAIIIGGFTPGLIDVARHPTVIAAAANSTSIAVATAIIVLGAALLLAEARVYLRTRPALLTLLDASVMVYLVVPSIVMGTALFILLRRVADMFVLAPFLVLAANVMLGLPFAYRLLVGKWLMLRQRQLRLVQLYNLGGWVSFRYLLLPQIGRECGFVFGLVAAMSVGDLGVIALFASADFQTMPWVLLQQASRYRLNAAANTALLLLLLTMLLFAVGDAMGRYFARPPSALPTRIRHA